jgi:heme O synthase-like polyprenyltransferase
MFGTIYVASALVLGGAFIALATRLATHPSRRAALRVHLASLAYLALLFVAMAVDKLV